MYVHNVTYTFSHLHFSLFPSDIRLSVHPYSYLAPCPDRHRITLCHRRLGSLLIGWLMVTSPWLMLIMLTDGIATRLIGNTTALYGHPYCSPLCTCAIVRNLYKPMCMYRCTISLTTSLSPTQVSLRNTSPYPSDPHPTAEVKLYRRILDKVVKLPSANIGSTSQYNL